LHRAAQAAGLTVVLALTAAAPARAAGWRVVASPSPAAQLNRLIAVTAAPGAPGFWAVGFSQAAYPSIPRTLIEHTTSTGWRVVKSPSPGRSGAELVGVAALSRENVWAVGTRGGPLVEHWTGRRWYVTPVQGAPRLGILGSVAAISQTDVWAVGTEGTSGIPFSAHWDGRTWRIVAMPDPGHEPLQMGDLTRIAGSHRLFAVGSQIGVHGRQVIERWSGSRWVVEPVPPLVRGAVSDGLIGVASVSGRSVWAVGTWLDASIVAHPLVEHWDGVRWRTVAGPGGQGELGALIVQPGTDRLWATLSGTGLPITVRYDGAAWVEVPAATPAGAADAEFAGIAAGRGTELVAVGSLDGGAKTLIERYP
jgi:hypothetical protein